MTLTFDSRPWNSIGFVWLSRYVFVQNFIELRAAVHELLWSLRECGRRRSHVTIARRGASARSHDAAAHSPATPTQGPTSCHPSHGRAARPTPAAMRRGTAWDRARSRHARASTAASRMHVVIICLQPALTHSSIMDLAACHQLDDQHHHHHQQQQQQQQTGVTEDCLLTPPSAAATSSTFGRKVTV